jgi:hypothetical protein
MKFKFEVMGGGLTYVENFLDVVMSRVFNPVKVSLETFSKNYHHCERNYFVIPMK